MVIERDPVGERLGSLPLGRGMVLVGINANGKESSNCRRCCGRRVLRGQGAAVG